MANQRALWINAGTLTQLATTDGLLAAALDVTSGALTIGASASLVRVDDVTLTGTTFDGAISGADLVFGSTNADTIAFDVGAGQSTKTISIGATNATSVQVDGLLVTGNSLYPAANGALTLGGTNTTTVALDGTGAITIGASATSVKVDDLTVTGASVDYVGVIEIGKADATNINIGSSGQTAFFKGHVDIAGDLGVTGNETITGSATFNGDTDIGDDVTDTLTITASVDAPINFASGGASHFTTTTGDLKIVPEGTTIAQGGLGTALTFTSYTTTNPVTNGVLTGIGTSFDTELQVGDAIEVELAGGIEVHTVAIITSALILEVDAPFVSLEAGVLLGLSTDDNLFEVYSGDAQARLTVGKNGGLVATRGEEHAAIITMANEEGTHENSFYIHDNDPTGIISGTIGDICLTAAAGTVYFNSGGGTAWTAVGSAGGDTLQLAYVAGAAISITSGEGDLAFTTTSADFTTTLVGGDWKVLEGANNYIASDYATDHLNLGSANIAVGFLGDVYTDITFDGTNQVVTNDGTGTIGLTKTGTSGDLTISNTATTGNVVLTSANDITIDTAGVNDIITITASSAGAAVDAISLITTGDGDIAITSADILDIDGADGVTIDAAGASNFTVTGNTLDLITTGTNTLTIDSGGALDVNAVGAVTVDTSSTIVMAGVGASSWTTSTGQLSLVTTTSGEIDLTSAGAVDINATAAVTIDSSAGTIGIGTDAVAQAINIGTGLAARTITVGNATGATLLDLDAGTGGVDIDSTGPIAINTSGLSDITIDSDDEIHIEADGILNINSSGGPMSIGNDPVGQLVNIGTGAAGRIVHVGNVTADTLLRLYSGTTGTDMNSTGPVTIDAAAASNFTVAGANLTLATTGTGEVLVDGVDGVEINSGSGPIDIGSDANTGAINIGAAATARAITVGNTTTTTDVDLTAGATGDITFAARGSAGNSLTYNDVTNQNITGGTYIGSETSVVSALLALDTAVSDAGDTILDLAPGAAITQYAGVYMAADGKVEMTDSDASVTAKFIGIALDAASAVDTPPTIRVQLAGEVSALGTLTVLGSTAYVSGTVGQLTVTGPTSGTILKAGIVSASGKVILQVGTAITL